MSESATSWTNLFASKRKAQKFTEEVEFRSFVKNGEPMLMVPHHRSAAAESLTLYPAQTPRARFVRNLLRRALACGIAPGAKRVRLALSSEDVFVQFLQSLTGDRAVPQFALFAGNPRAQGRRFLLLVFDAHQQPSVVVKAGADECAAQLIEKEILFLTSVSPDVVGIPRIRARFQHDQIHAFALDYVPGNSPRPRDADGIAPILNAWLDRNRTLRLSELPTWKKLVNFSGSDPLFLRLAQTLNEVSVHPTIFHGDFAPWNIKISPDGKAWTILDWERGELIGIPAWDWFHYVIQPALLVKKQPARDLAQTIQTMLDSKSFRLYAQAAGIVGIERQLLLAYLFHCRDVLRPAEGLQRTVELLNLLSKTNG